MLNVRISFLILLLINLFLPIFSHSQLDRNNWKCASVESFLEIEFLTNLAFLNSNKVTVLYQYTECRKCDLILLKELAKNQTELKYFDSTLINANYDYFFEVISTNSITGQNQTLCEKFKFDGFGECGIFKLAITQDTGCAIEVYKAPKNKYIGLYIGVPIIFIILIAFNLFEKYYSTVKRAIKNLIDRSPFREKKSSKIAHELDQKIEKGDIESRDVNVEAKDKKPQKVRYISLDVFRGFSILAMLFVLYGYFTYKINYHVTWYSFNFSSLVMPWFIWIMGVAVPISLNAILLKPNVNRWRVFVKITWRSIKLFGIGLILNIDYNWKWSTIRYFGVLQRIALCYFVLALVELIFWRKIDADKYKDSWLYYISDLIYSIPHSIIVGTLLLVWYLIIFLLPVPGCPTG